MDNENSNLINKHTHQGLSEDYIEQQVQSSKYPEDVRRSIRRFYEELERPAAPIVGFATSEDTAEKLLTKLNERGLEAVSDKDAKAVDPNVFVVTRSGVQSPFFAPEDALKANIMMIEAINDSGGRAYLSNPLTRESLVPAINPDEKNNQEVIDLKSIAKANPNNRYDEVMADFVEEYPKKDSFKRLTAVLKESKKDNPNLSSRLIASYQAENAALGGIKTPERDSEIAQKLFSQYKTELAPYIEGQYQATMLAEAKEKGVDPCLPNQPNIESMAKDEKLLSVFHGGKKGGKPFAILANSEKMSFTYGSALCSPDSIGNYASDGSIGYAFNKSSHNVRKYSSGQDYGFVYQYKSRDDKQEFTYIDNASPFKDGKFNPESINGSGETPILPHQNKIEKMYMAFEVYDKDGCSSRKVMPLELDENAQIKDKRWRDFVELHNPVDDNLKGFMVERRNNLISQYDDLGSKNMERKLSVNTSKETAEINAENPAKASQQLQDQNNKPDKKSLAQLIMEQRGLAKPSSNTSSSDASQRSKVLVNNPLNYKDKDNFR